MSLRMFNLSCSKVNREICFKAIKKIKRIFCFFLLLTIKCKAVGVSINLQNKYLHCKKQLLFRTIVLATIGSPIHKFKEIVVWK